MARDLCRGGGRPPSTFSSDDCGHPAKDRRDSE
jgi:hypothetical protein